MWSKSLYSSDPINIKNETSSSVRPECQKCRNKKPIIHGYQNNGLARYRCKQCNITYNQLTGTPLARLRTPIKDVTESIHMFATGTTQSDIARIKHKTEKTIANWIWRAMTHCLKFINYFLKDITAYFIQFDELYTFVQNKGNKKLGWMCIEVFSRLLVSFVIGDWTNKIAKKMLGLTKSRLKTNPLVITTDGLERYTEFVPEFFPTSLYAQVVKKYKKHRLDSVEIKPINGTLNKIIQVIAAMGLGKTVNTSYIERLNLTARNSVNSLARKTWCVVKKHIVSVGKMYVFQAFYDFIRTHMSLEGRTPAMAAGVTDHVWNWHELLTYKL